VISIVVLGPVELRRDGVAVPVRPGKTTELLVRLALEAGVMVRTERLIEDLWADEAVGLARNPLQTKVSRLRRSLGDGSLVTGSRAGYVLNVAPAAVDALEVLHLADEAASAKASDPAAALALCTTALTMFHGDVLPDAGDGDWVAPHRVRLDEARLGLIEDQLAARLDLGGAGDVVAELEGLLSRHPLRERLWVSLITALYRSGRQADALGAYARVRETLVEQLGLTPGPALQALEHQVLLQDPVLDGSPTPGRTPPYRRRSHLPALTSPMTGRDGDLASVSQLLANHRLVTLVGPAGVGKTRLAIEVANTVERPNGVCLVRLEGARNAATVLAALGEALGVSERSEGSVIDHLRGSDLLLVLDNCEQVVDDVAGFVTVLVSATPTVGVLCSSQLPLGLDGEAVYDLAPLSLADSVLLFEQRASAQQRSSFVMPNDAEPTVVAVCRALDGLPLAIELAAARTRTMSIEEIGRRLDDRFALLRDPASRRPDRQRALEAAISWSYELLFPDDQRGLWALGCFDDGAPLAGVEHVLGALEVPSESAIDVIGRLADRSLVAVEFPVDGGAARYRLLDSIRAFARDRLRDTGLDEFALRAQADWLAAIAADGAGGVRGPEQAQHLRTCREERVNIDAALAWASAHDPALGLRIATGFGWASVLLGDGRLGSDRLTAALAAAASVSSAEDRVRPLSYIAWLEVTSNIEQARAAAEEAVSAADSAGDRYLAAFSRSALALVLIQNGGLDRASLVLDESRRLLDAAHPWDLGGTWILSAHAALLRGDVAAASAACSEADRLLRTLGDDWALDHLDALLGYIAQAEERFDDAATHLRRAAGAAEHLGYAATQASHLDTLGRVLEQAGQVDEAITTFQRVIEIGRTTRQLRLLALGRVHLGRVLRSHGDRHEALIAVQAADHWFESSGGGDGAALAACLHSAMDAEDGDPSAEPRLRAVLQQADGQHTPDIEIMAMDALARCAATDHDHAAACDLLDAADHLMPSARHLLGANDRPDAAHARTLIAAGSIGNEPRLAARHRDRP
jgi:predicted ATPase/DNA-binding SARP family transcriptional activator